MADGKRAPEHVWRREKVGVVDGYQATSPRAGSAVNYIVLSQHGEKNKKK